MDSQNLDLKQTDLKQTLNLPKTAFSMKANLPQPEPKMLERWEKEKLYHRIREARAGKPTYILHDGPPYANGRIHLGTAFNKILKDFIVKSKTMAGFDAPYVPGWDCHGLPIEIKVDEKLGKKKLEMDPLRVRQECRAYADNFLNIQREQFQRLGVFGRFDRPYSTLSPDYEAVIVETLFSFLEKDAIYNGLRPVYCSILAKTSLPYPALEYTPHLIPSMCLKAPLTAQPP